MEPITKEEYESWAQDSVTRKVIIQLELKILNIEQQLAQGKTLNEDSAESTLAATAKAIGKIEGINEIFKIDIE